MTIKQKIQIDKFIEKGGQVAADNEKDVQWTNFCLRMKKSMSKEIDAILEDCEGVNKTGFILQAIREKIKKHQQEQE